MKTYILYIVGLVSLMAVLALSIHAHLLWPSVALGVALLWLCLSLYGRIGRLLYAYRKLFVAGDVIYQVTGHTLMCTKERDRDKIKTVVDSFKAR